MWGAGCQDHVRAPPGPSWGALPSPCWNTEVRGCHGICEAFTSLNPQRSFPLLLVLGPGPHAQSDWLTQVRCDVLVAGIRASKCLAPSCPRRKAGLAVGPCVGVDTLGSQNLITSITQLHGQWKVIKGCFSYSCFYFWRGCAGSFLLHAGFLKLR